MADPSAGTSPSQVAGIARPIGIKEIDQPLRVRRNLIQGAVQRDLNARSPAAVTVGTWEGGPWTSIMSAPIGEVTGHFPLPADGPVQIVSSSAADTAPAGTGTNSIRVTGVVPGGGTATGDPFPTDDAPWQSDTVGLTGVVPVVSARSFHGGLVRAAVIGGAGTTFSNVGTISITRVSDGRLLHLIHPRWGASRNEWFPVPLGWIAVVRRVVPYWSGDVQCRWRLREHDAFGRRFSELGGSLQVENSGPEVNLDGGRVIPGGSTFWFEAQRDAGGAGALNIFTVYADVEFWLSDDLALSL